MNTASEFIKEQRGYKNILTIPFSDGVEDNYTNSAHSYNQLYSEEKEVQISGLNSNNLSVFDVAAYILLKMGKMTTMKLHKLLYYSQAWNLVWCEEPLFNEKLR